MTILLKHGAEYNFNDSNAGRDYSLDVFKVEKTAEMVWLGGSNRTSGTSAPQVPLNLPLANAMW